jgi:hypothetical protein
LKDPVVLGVGEIHRRGEIQSIRRTRRSRHARRDLPERHQLFCARIRQRLEQDAVEDAEHRGVRADAKRECQHHDHGEREVVAQGATGVPDILPERVNDRDGQLIAIRVPDLRQSTHCAASGGTGVVSGLSLRAGFRLEAIQVVRQLRVQVGVEPALAEHVENAPPDHRTPAGLTRNLAISATVSSQSSVSSRICRRPWAVSS